MEQPTQYNSENELIEWLKYDLDEQRKSIAKENGITKEEVENKDLVLNIGYKGNLNYNIKDKIRTAINFDFKIVNIIKKLGYNSLEIDIKIQCQYVDFSRDANFSRSTFNGVANFVGSTFNGVANFVGSTFNGVANFVGSTFNGVAYFVGSTFNGVAYFSSSTFNKWANFSSSTFNGEASFNDVKFSSYTNVDSREKIESEISFRYIKIKDKLLLNNIELDNNEKSRIIFDELEFLNNNALLQIKKSKTKKPKDTLDTLDTFKSMSFKDILINGRIDIQNIKTDNVDFLGSVVNGGVVNTVNFTVDKFDNRESALFLKHQAYIMHNNIEALQYKAKEMEMYRAKLKTIKNKTWENWAEILSMFLSKLSNNHGQNWFQAICFTVLISFLFFVIFYSPTLNLIFKMPCSYYSDFFPSLIAYLIPVNYNFIVEYAGYKHINILIKLCGIFVYTLGKVSFGYGVVQVVQAFRKYNKSS